MDEARMRDELRHHQERSMGVLARGLRCLDEGQAALLAAGPGLRAEMWDALGGYRTFKHELIFDPAIESGDPERAAMARALKVDCIGAGETFRTHMSRWTPDKIAADWTTYRAEARLTVKQLRRHIDAEGKTISAFLDRFGAAMATADHG